MFNGKIVFLRRLSESVAVAEVEEGKFHSPSKLPVYLYYLVIVPNRFSVQVVKPKPIPAEVYFEVTPPPAGNGILYVFPILKVK